MSASQPLPVVRVGEIQSEEDAHRWLVEELWGASSVGVIGGAPEMCEDVAGTGHRLECGHRHGVLG